jgi:hypothetical protein
MPPERSAPTIREATYSALSTTGNWLSDSLMYTPCATALSQLLTRSQAERGLQGPRQQREQSGGDEGGTWVERSTSALWRSKP